MEGVKRGPRKTVFSLTCLSLCIMCLMNSIVFSLYCPYCLPCVGRWEWDHLRGCVLWGLGIPAGPKTETFCLIFCWASLNCLIGSFSGLVSARLKAEFEYYVFVNDLNKFQSLRCMDWTVCYLKEAELVICSWRFLFFAKGEFLNLWGFFCFGCGGRRLWGSV